MEKTLAVVVIFLFCLLYTAAIAAQERNKSSFETADAARAEVTRLGFGKRVNLKLQNGTQTGGRITGLGGDHFVVTDSKRSAPKNQFGKLVRGPEPEGKSRHFLKSVAGLGNTAASVYTVLV